MLLFDLTPALSASDIHTSHPSDGNIGVEFKFNKPLSKATTCLLHLKFDNSVLVNFARTFMTDF